MPYKQLTVAESCGRRDLRIICRDAATRGRHDPGTGERADHRRARRRPRGRAQRAADAARGRAGIEVVAEAGDADSATRYVKGHRPAVLILDINMPGGSGLAAIPTIREQSPETQIVMLTMQDETASAREALQAGVLGYILKEAAERGAGQGRADGGRGQDLPAARARRPARGRARDRAPDDLSDRELEVLRLIALGPHQQRDRRAASTSACAPSSRTAPTSSRSSA